MRPPFTPSTMARAVACPASHALPAAFESSADADRGTARHVEVFAAPPPAIVEWFSGQPVIEQAVALSPDGARRLDADGRNYETSDGEIPGRVDLHRFADGALSVADLKTGASTPTPAAESLQLRTYALALSRVYGVDYARTAIIWEREPGAPIVIDTHDLDSLDLDEHARLIKRTAERVEEARALVDAGKVPDVHPSDGACRWCPALRAGCPAYTALARAVVVDLETIRDRVTAMSDPEAGVAWQRVAQAEKILEVVKESLRARALQSPIPLGKGKVLRAVPWSRWEKSDAAKAKLSAVEEELRASGEIYKVDALQVRAVKE